MNLDELMKWDPPPFTTIIGDKQQGILVPLGKMLVYGRWGTWKSMLVQDMCIKMAVGADWLGFNTIPSSSFYLQVEVPQAQMRDRVEKYLQGNNILVPPTNVRIWSTPFYKINRDSSGYLNSHLASKSARVVVYDPATKLISGSLNDIEDMTRLVDKVDETADRHKVASVIVGHIRKPSHDDAQEEGLSNLEHELIGSSALADWADTMISLQLVNGDNEVHLQFEKVRHSHILVPPRHIVWNRGNLKGTVIPCACRNKSQS
tara:strand:- start:849 stop:1631 length:783 start_codon:yes stop_codon:yes gene_type:complete